MIAYIGGATPSRPTLIADAVIVPSGILCPAIMKICALGLRSSMLPGTNRTTGVFRGTMIFFSPSALRRRRLIARGFDARICWCNRNSGSDRRSACACDLNCETIGYRRSLHSTLSNISTICSAARLRRVAARSLFELGRDMLPCRLSPRLFRQMPDQRPHVGERDQIHDGRDCQRPWQGARPVRAGTHRELLPAATAAASMI